MPVETEGEAPASGAVDRPIRTQREYQRRREFAMDDHSRDPAKTSRPAAGQRTGPENIRRLRALANRGLFALALFVALSIGAIRDFDILPSFPVHFRELLGHPPSANMISGVLLLYSFAAIVLILSRMTTGSDKFGPFANVGYLAGFYFFYHFSGALEENFWAVFAAGLTVLSLETYHIRNYCSEAIRKEQDALAGIRRDDRDSD
jgi:hypothetical protein